MTLLKPLWDTATTMWETQPNSWKYAGIYITPKGGSTCELRRDIALRESATSRLFGTISLALWATNSQTFRTQNTQWLPPNFSVMVNFMNKSIACPWVLHQLLQLQNYTWNISKRWSLQTAKQKLKHVFPYGNGFCGEGAWQTGAGWVSGTP